MTIKLLSIAGTDPSGGAGIQADLKTFSALGGYGASVITALVAQNTQGVRAIHIPPLTFLQEQLDAVFEDISFDAVKIGMLANREIIEQVAKTLEKWNPPFVVLDPVMVAKSGDPLLTFDAIETLKSKLLPLVDLITPNLPEASILLDSPTPQNENHLYQFVRQLKHLTRGQVLLKGGHAHFDLISSSDYLTTQEQIYKLEAPRIKTRAGHGTGCTLSVAICALWPKYKDYYVSTVKAKNYLHEALSQAEALSVGQGGGPVHHFHAWWPVP